MWSPQIGLSSIRLVLVHHEWKSRQKRYLFDLQGQIGKQQLVKIVDELVEVTASS
jgi:hypothetical protein